MHKSVRRITLVQPTSGGNTATTLYKRSKKKKRKSSKAMSTQEKLARRMLEANELFGDELLRKHNKSARDRKDGWVADSNLNMSKAGRKAFKHFVRI